MTPRELHRSPVISICSCCVDRVQNTSLAVTPRVLVDPSAVLHILPQYKSCDLLAEMIHQLVFLESNTFQFQLVVFLLDV